jgi:YD repeat-containing protein
VDTQNRLTTVSSDPASNRVTGLSDPAGRTTAYAYDAAADLTTATDLAGGTWAYAYTGHDLTTITDPRGNDTLTRPKATPTATPATTLSTTPTPREPYQRGNRI